MNYKHYFVVFLSLVVVTCAKATPPDKTPVCEAGSVEVFMTEKLKPLLETQKYTKVLELIAEKRSVCAPITYEENEKLKGYQALAYFGLNDIVNCPKTASTFLTADEFLYSTRKLGADHPKVKEVLTLHKNIKAACDVN